MARMTLAIGSSHGPMLNSTGDEFLLHAARDKRNKGLLNREGEPRTFDELIAEAPPHIEAELRQEVRDARAAACDRNIARLAEDIAAARLDAIIVIGDDQHEQLLNDNLPSVLIYWGETIENGVMRLPEDSPEYWKKARSQYHETDAPRTYPVESALARHMIESLVDEDFDIAASNQLPRERGEGHAFGFVHRRLMAGSPVPMVPVMLNTYFPPNQPTPRRCHALGQAIRRAVESWDNDAKVGIVASGGLSHFIVDEELDREVMRAFGAGDGAAMTSIPPRKLNSGSSEIRNWICTGGAADGLSLKWSEYEPGYRSIAGTGCGLGFAVLS